MDDTTNGAGKLDALRKREAEIKARIAAEEDKRKRRAQREEDRLKAILGAALLAHVAVHPETREGLAEVLKSQVTAPRDLDFLKSKRWV